MSVAAMVRCYIGLGSNLKNPLQQLNQAKQKIIALPKINVLNCSSIYQSAALTIDDEPQNDYLNAVIEIQTTLNPEQLLDGLQQIECQQGRIRETRWGARTLDLDILLYAEQQIKTARLTVPHIEIKNRNFVLLPLFELSPNLKIPNIDSLQKAIEKNQHQVLEKVNEFKSE